MKYENVHARPEDERIDMIGNEAMRRGTMIAFVTDDEPGKAERYIAKLTEKFPEIEIIDQFKGPTPGAVSVRIKRKSPP